MSMGSLKKLLRDERVWCVACVVGETKDGGKHYELSEADPGRYELMVHVYAKTSHTPIWAHCNDGDRGGSGRWRIPDIGTEVMVAFGDGDGDGDAFIVGRCGRFRGTMAEHKTYLIDQAIEARSSSGTAVALATKADLDALANWIQNHLSIGGTGSTPIPPDNVPQPTGTLIFKAE